MELSVIVYAPSSSELSAAPDTGAWTPVLIEAGYAVKAVSSPSDLIALLEADPTLPVLIPASANPAALDLLSAAQRQQLLVVGRGAEELGAWLEQGLSDFVLWPLGPPLLHTRIEVRRSVLLVEQGVRDLARHTELTLLERDVTIGRTIQTSFLPERLPQPPGWDLAAFFQPAREVAGDFYDSFELLNKRRVGVVMADVCDKGVPAALFMALFRTLIRAGAQQHISLSWAGPGSFTDDVLWQGELSAPGGHSGQRRTLPRIGSSALLNAVCGTNTYMTENHLSTGYFVTLFFALFDPASGELLYVNGGHNPPLILRAGGGYTLLPATGPAVGMMPDAQYRVGEATLHPGDVLFTYTDGVTEAKDTQGRFFGLPRLMELLQAGPILDAQALMDRLQAALDEHIGLATQFDDITMLVVRREGVLAR